MGTHFWAFEQHGVIPDIVVMGKPIANGYPMGAVVCRPEVARAFDNGMEFFSTFGGSTAALAAAHETLRVTLDGGLQEHALRVGSALLSRLRELQHPLIGDIRGSGLFLGIELVRNRETREPADTEAALVAESMRDHGILLGTDGPWHNVIKLRGPMVINFDDVEILATTLAGVLDDV
jgi:4-aminobutyrate aminotransferase-like enzyme